MKYKALKPCSFDTFYPIGAEIPESVLDSGRIPFLLDIGMLKEITDSTIKNQETQADEGKRQSDAEQNADTLSASQLAAMKKDDLIAYAKDHGLDLDATMTKDQIVEAIKLL
jgi:hypothetical protein|nr:MAG TPA_asm: HeH/LEM domain [Caudoviricetes sp.]